MGGCYITESLSLVHCDELERGDAETAMAPHSSTLPWRIPWTEEPGGLPSVGSLRVGRVGSREAPPTSSFPGFSEPP